VGVNIPDFRAYVLYGCSLVTILYTKMPQRGVQLRQYLARRN